MNAGLFSWPAHSADNNSGLLLFSNGKKKAIMVLKAKLKENKIKTNPQRMVGNRRAYLSATLCS